MGSAAGNIGQASPYQPRHGRDHAAPAQKTYHRRDLRVVWQHAQAGEDGVPVVFDVIGIAGGDERQQHGAGVGHVGGGVQPVFEEEEGAESESGGLSLAEEVCSQEQRHQPLQNGASPESERGTKPAEQKMSAFVDNQICQIDEEKRAMLAERVYQEHYI